MLNPNWMDNYNRNLNKKKTEMFEVNAFYDNTTT